MSAAEAIKDTAQGASPAPNFDHLFSLLSEEDRKIFSKPSTDIPRAGKFIANLSKNSAYKAAKTGAIQTYDFNGVKRVSTAWLWETWRHGRRPLAA